MVSTPLWAVVATAAAVSLGIGMTMALRSPGGAEATRRLGVTLVVLSLALLVDALAQALESSGIPREVVAMSVVFALLLATAGVILAIRNFLLDAHRRR
jgi:hypothetical protein